MIRETSQRAREALGETGDRARGRGAGEEVEQFRVDARDFLSARERSGSAGTRIEQRTATLSEAAEILNRSFPEMQASG
ncbi:MAG: SPFH domain-containing protein, partial [Rubrobacteraceae bacterium]